MSKEPSKNQNSSQKVFVIVMAIIALLVLIWVFQKKPAQVVAEDKPVETADTVKNDAEVVEAPEVTPDAQPTEEQAPEPAKNAETAYLIEDFTDPNKKWDNYKMSNVVMTAEGITLAPGATEGVFESPPLPMAFPGNMVAPLWKQEVPQGAAVDVQMAISPDNQMWSDWYPLPDTGDDISPIYPDGTPNPNYGHVPGSYISTGLDLSAFTRYRFTLRTTGGETEYRKPDGTFADRLLLSRLRVYYLDSTLGEGKPATEYFAGPKPAGEGQVTPEAPAEGGAPAGETTQ
jgi:hypothetical protein